MERTFGQAEREMTVLARGSRLAIIRVQGLVLEDAVTGRRSVTPVAVVDRLPAEDSYDMALVAVRRDSCLTSCRNLRQHGISHLCFSC
jgi:ketopantoate reductase